MSGDRWQEALRRLKTARTVTYDSETSGLDWRVNAIVGHVLTFGPRPADSYYLPVRHQAGGNIMDHPGLREADSWDATLHPIEKELIQGLDDPNKIIYGFHWHFDAKFLSRLGFTLEPRFRDGMINAALLDEHSPKFSLEYLCSVAGIAAKKTAEIYAHIKARFPEVTERNFMSMFWRLAGDDPIAIDYAEGDGTSTVQLIEWQDKQLAQQELGLVHDVESRLIPVLARMSLKGIKVDEDRLFWLSNHIDNDLLAPLYAKLPKDFNTRSATDVMKWCVDHGQTGWPFTPGRITNKSTGERTPQPSFPEAWLETHEAGRQIVRVRKLENLKNSFVQPMIDTHLYKGRVHTEFNQLRGDEYGTVTGRLSSSHPNMQQIPKRNEDMGRLFRSIFVPDEGLIWGDADYRQCEPLLLAYYSRAPVLVNGFLANPPVDPHSAVTRSTNPGWEKMLPTEFKAAREIGKRVNQTIITGGGAGVLEHRYHVPNAKQVMANYFAAMPEVKNLQRKAARRFEQRGYLLSLLGRRARLKDRDKSYTGVNRLLQVGNADIIKAKLVQIDDYLASINRPMDVLNNVHDAISFQFPEPIRPVYQECLRIMTDFSPGQLIELDLPLLVDTGEGRSWEISTYGEQK